MAVADQYNTMDTIKNLWPDFKFTKADFLEARPDFVVTVFKRFLTEYKELLSEIGELEENEEQCNFIEFIETICNVSRILKDVEHASITLVDFVGPVKRIHVNITYCIHFLTFMYNNREELLSLPLDLMQQGTKCKILLEDQEEFLRKIASLSTMLGAEKEKEAEFKNYLKEVDEEYQRKLDEKSATEKYLIEGASNLESLQKELDDLDKEYTRLEERKQFLEGEVVHEEEIAKVQEINTKVQNNLEEKKTLFESLKAEYDQKKSCCETISNVVNRLYDRSTGFDNLQIYNFIDAEEERIRLEALNKTLEKDLKKSEVLIEMKTKEINEINDAHKIVQIKIGELDSAQEENKLKECYKKLMQEKLKYKDVEYNRSMVIDQINEIDNSRKELQEEMLKRYGQILTDDAKVTEYFYEFLSLHIQQSKSN